MDKSNMERIKCPYCPKDFLSKESWRKHKSRFHTSTKQETPPVDESNRMPDQEDFPPDYLDCFSPEYGHEQVDNNFYSSDPVSILPTVRPAVTHPPITRMDSAQSDGPTIPFYIVDLERTANDTLEYLETCKLKIKNIIFKDSKSYAEYYSELFRRLSTKQKILKASLHDKLVRFVEIYPKNASEQMIRLLIHMNEHIVDDSCSRDANEILFEFVKMRTKYSLSHSRKELRVKSVIRDCLVELNHEVDSLESYDVPARFAMNRKFYHLEVKFGLSIVFVVLF